MNGEWVLITGASSGIGLALARIFAANGFNLVLIARDRERLAQLADELVTRHRVQARVMAKDLAAPASPAEILAETQASGITIHVLVNDAGFGLRGALAQMELPVAMDMIQVNVNALVQVTRLFLPPMLARGKGRILNVASTAAFLPGPSMAVYYATKAFVSSFSCGLAEELAGTGVTVTTLYPGPTRTDFHRRAGTTGSQRLLARWTMEADDVARLGYDALMRGKRMLIPGFANKAGFVLCRCLPAAVMAKIARRIIEH